MVISSAQPAVEFKSISSRIAAAVRMPLVALSRYYSMVLEREINIRQTLMLLNAQTAFVFAVFPSTARSFFVPSAPHGYGMPSRNVATYLPTNL